MCKYVELPRGTVYRMLETLCAAGYAHRDPHMGGYWVKRSASDLCSGYADQSWVLECGPKIIEDLRTRIKSCIAISTPFGTDMLIRLSTKVRNPGANEKTIAGQLDPMGKHVDGHVYLAFSPPERAKLLLNQIYSKGDVAAKISNRDDEGDFQINAISLPRTGAVRELERIRQRGYTIQNRSSVTGAAAVPILRGGVAVGALKIWYWHSAVKAADFDKRYLPMLLAAAKKLSEFPGDEQQFRKSDLSALG
jgi:IclR family mhp operon transcriptional activator